MAPLQEVGKTDRVGKASEDQGEASDHPSLVDTPRGPVACAICDRPIVEAGEDFNFPATTPYSMRVPVVDGCIAVVLAYLCHNTLLSRCAKTLSIEPFVANSI